jgi:hypothetical protein
VRVWRWLRASELGPETHLLTRRVFLLLLALVYLSAFASLWVQVDGLIGSRGISPAADFLAEVAGIAEGERFWRVPTLLWLGNSDTALHLLCGAGVLLSLLLGAGVAARLCAALLWLAYLSLVSAGGIFLRYQWDALLIEAGFLAIWVAPAVLSPSKATRAPVDTIAVWLLRVLLFKLMFLSGVVKLQSGDSAWLELTAMELHYFTQPLPDPVSFYAHHLPAWFHRGEVVATFVFELGVPWLIFAPRRLRWAAWPALVGLQLMISATGNYGFFNLLSVALCTWLLDDAVLRGLLRRRQPPDALTARVRGWKPARVIFAALATLLFSLNALLLLDKLGTSLFRPMALVELQRQLGPFHVVNSYGLFAVMTRQRDEIGIEGSQDGVEWRAYGFRYKPGPPPRAPRFAGLHMPRLDWQLWFASLRGCAQASWLHAFLLRVLEGEPSVLGLLEQNPFPDAPPRYLRTPFIRYEFAPPGGEAWWTTQDRGEFCPAVAVPPESQTSCWDPGGPRRAALRRGSP